MPCKHRADISADTSLTCRRKAIIPRSAPPSRCHDQWLHRSSAERVSLWRLLSTLLSHMTMPDTNADAYYRYSLSIRPPLVKIMCGKRWMLITLAAARLPLWLQKGQQSWERHASSQSIIIIISSWTGTAVASLDGRARIQNIYFFIFFCMLAVGGHASSISVTVSKTPEQPGRCRRRTLTKH